MIPAHQAAPDLGLTTSTLNQLCEDGCVINAEVRGIGDRAQWWVPDSPIILRLEDRLGLRGPVPDGMAPLTIIARRDGLSVPSLSRLCRLGKVRGARKVLGQWFIPWKTKVERPKRGRRPIDLSPWPEWMHEPTNGN